MTAEQRRSALERINKKTERDTASYQKAVDIYQPARAIVGNCPVCGDVLVVLNNYETWPWVVCRCSWGGTTHAIANRQRIERI